MFSVVASTCVGVLALLGLLVVFMVFFRPMKPPADESNRIAHLILVWEALKSPHRFVGLQRLEGNNLATAKEAFPYLTQDLGEFVRGKDRI
jgi:hypothetical protein